MSHTRSSVWPTLLAAVALVLVLAPPAWAGGKYRNFSVAVYFRYQEVQSTPSNLARFGTQWANLERQVGIDKVYLETTRNNQLATEQAVTALKAFFAPRGIKVSGALGLTLSEPNGFQSFCYSTPAQRERVKAMAQFTARLFDEVILDDFFFANCKCDLCIAAKGERSWTEFRCAQMDDVARELIIAPSRAANANIRLIIKYPNWYESYQGLGYDLAVQPGLFDAIYAGTETRNANFGQRLQSYQSYLLPAYFNNIKPGGCQGGWIDGGGDDRYAEQFWDTLLAKVPEITLFNSQQVMGPLRGGAATDPNATLARLMAPIPLPDGGTYTPDMVGRTAGYAAEILDRILGRLGKPIGVVAYKPPNSTGEPYLHGYLGMLGIPIDLVPEFPSTIGTLLLTASSRHDKDLVAKTKRYVQAGGRVIATTGLMEALGANGFQDIAEIEATGKRVMVKSFGGGGFGGRGGRGAAAGAAPEPDLNILMPQLRNLENDTWTSIAFNTAASGYPMVVGTERSTNYGRGVFYALAIPDDFADLYRLPASVHTQLRSLLGGSLFVRLTDCPPQVSLLTYDNNTFVIQNFRDQAVTARVSVTRAARLRDLLTDQVLTPGAAGGGGGGFGAGGFGGGGLGGGAGGATFEVQVPGHSIRAFAAE